MMRSRSLRYVHGVWSVCLKWCIVEIMYHAYLVGLLARQGTTRGSKSRLSKLLFGREWSMCE